MSFIHRLRSRHQRASTLPDPAKPPENRGPWADAAVTNVEITEQVKRQIGAVTRPWNK